MIWHTEVDNVLKGDYEFYEEVEIDATPGELLEYLDILGYGVENIEYDDYNLYIGLVGGMRISIHIDPFAFKLNMYRCEE